MSNAIFTPPAPHNEPVLSYAPGSPERKALQTEYDRRIKTTIDAPMWIAGKAVETKDLRKMSPPHKHAHKLGMSHHGDAKHVKAAIDAALKAKRDWEHMPWEERAAIYLKAADLISGPYRASINAASMLAQSKNAFQAEIDAACEFADFLRFNVSYMVQIYRDQPQSSAGIWNRLEYRPLEGFVFALYPVQLHQHRREFAERTRVDGQHRGVEMRQHADAISAQVIMEVFRLAGMPDGVINLIHVDGQVVGDIICNHKDFAGIHFTGSTGVFRTIWGRRSATTSPTTGATHGSLERPVARTSWWRTPAPIRWPWPRHFHAAPSSSKGRNAVPPAGPTSRTTCGRR